VACPNVLAIANWSNAEDEADKTDKQKSSNTSSSCLFIEHVQGCTVRQYFEQRMESSREDSTPSMKRQRRGEEDGDNSQVEFKKEDRITTVIDTHTLSVAYSIGTLVGKMHAAGVIHGDLTTSNIMVTNAPKTSDNQEVAEQAWKPNLILIDFGLATSTNSTIITASSDASSNNKKQHKQQHSAEEKAVDLYVLERAFLSTHPESEQLVEEVLKGYREFFEGLSSGNTDGEEKSGEATYGHVAKAIFNRLEQVRMRGRKRECFG
jgi:TP53 regulating kinase-like protein